MRVLNRLRSRYLRVDDDWDLDSNLEHAHMLAGSQHKDTLAVKQQGFGLASNDSIKIAAALKHSFSAPCVDSENRCTLTITRSRHDEKFGIMLTRVQQSIIVILVRPNSMGSRAGLAFGDEILLVDGHSVQDMSARAVARLIVSHQTATLQVRKQPHIQRHTLVYEPEGKIRSGLKVRDGVVCILEPNSPAALAGIKKDTVIVAVDQTNTICALDKDIKKRLKARLVVHVQTIPRHLFEQYVRGIPDKSQLKGGM